AASVEVRNSELCRSQCRNYRQVERHRAVSARCDARLRLQGHGTAIARFRTDAGFATGSRAIDPYDGVPSMRTHHREIAPAGTAPRRRRRSGIAETVASSAARNSAVARHPLDGPAFRAHADALFGDAPDGITMQQGGRIVYANRRMAELTGHGDPAGLVGLSSLHFYAEDDLTQVLAR